MPCAILPSLLSRHRYTECSSLTHAHSCLGLPIFSSSFHCAGAQSAKPCQMKNSKAWERQKYGLVILRNWKQQNGWGGQGVATVKLWWLKHKLTAGPANKPHPKGKFTRSSCPCLFIPVRLKLIVRQTNSIRKVGRDEAGENESVSLLLSQIYCSIPLRSDAVFGGRWAWIVLGWRMGSCIEILSASPNLFKGITKLWLEFQCSPFWVLLFKSRLEFYNVWVAPSNFWVVFIYVFI